MFTRNPTLWSIWPEIGLVAKLCILIPLLVGFYTLSSTSFIFVRLRSLAKSRQPDNPEALSPVVARLVTKSNNLRNLLVATFYLFGFMLFTSFPNVFVTMESADPITEIMHNLNAHFAVAAKGFLIFLVLHCVQWFVSCRVRAFALSLKTQL